MPQSRRGSAVEAVTNVVAGLGIAWLVTYTALPLLGVEINAWQTSQVSVIFTGVSLARSYLLRRLFNHINMRQHVRQS